MTALGSFFGSSGISDERFHLFLATGLRNEGDIRREPTEQIELEAIPLEDATELALSGAISDGPSALAIILANHRASRIGLGRG